jgi:hypothetical protein
LVHFEQLSFKLARNICEFIVGHKVAKADWNTGRATNGIRGNPEGHGTAVLAKKGMQASKPYQPHLEGQKAHKAAKLWNWSAFVESPFLALELHPWYQRARFLHPGVIAHETRGTWADELVV